MMNRRNFLGAVGAVASIGVLGAATLGTVNNPSTETDTFQDILDSDWVNEDWTEGSDGWYCVDDQYSYVRFANDTNLFKE